jgi:S-DNA-T family DNA segregation ATPase FtsK/SpoIIIE
MAATGAPASRFQAASIDARRPGFVGPFDEPLATTARGLLPVPRDVRGQENVLTAKLEALGIPCELERILQGPQLTRYELRPTTGALMRDILRTADDLAYATGAYPARVIAPLPDRAGLIAVELPCAQRRIVRLDELPPSRAPLSVPLGLDLDGEPVWCDIASAPHLMIAGQTGSGKSSLINAMLCSLLSRFGPDEVCFVLIDPKQVELNRYESIPHLLAPVATDVRQALARLRSTVKLMELRYEVAARFGARSLPELNVKLELSGHLPCPYVLVVIDELADLMITSRKQCEPLIVRLAQKARAVGIHLVLATQSPRVSVISGLLKANIPTRIAFSVPQQVDSRVILDRHDAEALLGRGDGLLSINGAQPIRFQGGLVDSDQIEAVCDRWRQHV